MRHGGAAFQKLIDRATPVTDYKWQQLAGDWPNASIFQRQEKVREFLRFLRHRDLDPIRRGLIIKRLSELTGIESTALHALLRMMTSPPASTPSRTAPVSSGRELAEAWLIGCLLVQPAIYLAMREEIILELFHHHRLLAARLLEIWEDNPTPTIAEVVAALEDPGLVSEAIRLERSIDDWQTASRLPNGAASRGVTVESMARDVLETLKKPNVGRKCYGQ
jgi:hypothetical protein